MLDINEEGREDIFEVSELPETGRLTMGSDDQAKNTLDIPSPQSEKSEYCDVTAGVEANGTRIILCLLLRKFIDDDVLIRNYKNIMITVYGDKSKRTRIPIESWTTLLA